MHDQNHKLAAISVIKDSYKNVLVHLKSYLIISYAVMLPLFLIQASAPINMDPNGSFSWPLTFSLLGASILLILFAIYLYRLFILSNDQIFKVSINDLMKMILKSFLYSIALGAVLILAYLTLGLLFGLVLSIINSAAGGDPLSGARLANIITYSIMLFMLIVIFRVQPTFISIALGHKTIAMKSAYYYTRDNNKNILLIALSCYLPLIISGLLFALNSEVNDANNLISFLISPLKMLPYALQLSAGSLIYKELVMDVAAQHD
ncbi:MAG: hypothetical protein HOJ34_10235 [Kordiimonadaceae bacterium]|jgi:hypothetical protein|nr:hypothetical protein [Kordiimonadaceae bacterium]MBT6035445.1 hypothetical protein [Kordiimonadaceae bacterium]MBT6330148.1 hypothetical protein [Kordiimonadaceae bacterium]MBT7583067.1 hypothetical protein [Kordiimonadaceae bacterium]